jgi:hypothetical protein
MKSNRLFGSILVFYILFLTFGQSHAQQYSPEFKALLNQIQQNYLAPKGENLSSLQNKYPTVVATLIGHALRQQTVHVQQNPSLNNQFINLQREAGAYIGEVARTTSARFDDGSRYTPDALWSIVNRAFQGQDDGWVLQTFRVQNGTMPSVLASSHRPQQPQIPAGKPPMKEKKQIELLGQVAKGKPGKNDDNDLSGDWQSLYPTGRYSAAENPESYIVVRFNRQGNTYIGQVVQSGKLETHIHPVGTTFCKAERIDNGRFYKGIYYYYDNGAVKQAEVEMEVYGTDTDFCKRSKSKTCGHANISWKNKSAVYIYSVSSLCKWFNQQTSP